MIARFLKTVLLGAVMFVLPLGAVVFLSAKILSLSHKLIAPLLSLLPSTISGSVFYLPDNQIRHVPLSFRDAVRLIRHAGLGSKTILKDIIERRSL